MSVEIQLLQSLFFWMLTGGAAVLAAVAGVWVRLGLEVKMARFETKLTTLCAMQHNENRKKRTVRRRGSRNTG